MANCFTPLQEKKRPVQDIVIEYPKEVQEYNLIPKATKVIDADGVEVDSIIYEVVPGRKYDLQKYIDSFSDEVGIQNILRKVAMTGDKSYLNQTGRAPLNSEGGLEPVQDYSDAPKNKTEAFNIVVQGVQAYDSLPADIKEKMSFEQFATGFNQEQFNAYIEKIIAANKPQEGESK